MLTKEIHGQEIFVVGINEEYQVSVRPEIFSRAYNELVLTTVGSSYKPSRVFETREEAEAEAARIVASRGECRLA
jgi:hypothetical protein